MSTVKNTKEELKPVAAPGDEQQEAPDTVPNQKLRFLSLEVQDDDFGGDPYNRTGQFCQIELKNKEQ